MFFLASLNHCRHFWYSRNSCRELANDYVLLASRRSIVWEIVVATSFPCLGCIRSNNEKCINIHIAYIRNIRKMNKNKILTCYLNQDSMLFNQFYWNMPHAYGMFWGFDGVIETCCCHVSKYTEWLCFRESKHLPWHLLKT